MTREPTSQKQAGRESVGMERMVTMKIMTMVGMLGMQGLVGMLCMEGGNEDDGDGQDGGV